MGNNSQRTLWRILAGVLGVVVVGTGLTLAIRSERKAVGVKASLHVHRSHPGPKHPLPQPKKPAHHKVSLPTEEPIMLPVRGQIQADFGWQYSGAQNEWYYNPGITISAKAGTPVKAAWQGTVEKVVSNAKTGWEVMVDDGDHFDTAYSHLAKVDVRLGQNLQRGQELGTVGGTDLYSYQTGAHLNFQIYHGGLASNPLAYLHASS